MRRRRLQHGARLVGSSLLSLSLALSGCHKQSRSVSNQATAPDIAEENTPAPIVRATPPAASTQRVPVSPDALQGRPSLTEVGLASWYGPPYAGRKGADGTVYDQNAMTAAHLTLPLGSVVRVTNLANGQSTVVKITDRGPFVHGRIIDLSLAAAKATGIYRAGVAKVRLEEYTPPPSPNATRGGRWCVQIGAFYNADDAVQLKNDLLRRYATAKVIEFQGPTGYWVRITPKMPIKINAEEIVDSIHVPDAEAYLTRTD